ncbi:MAG: hypothetical protein FJW32_29980 [Acidobacteria bacterium]|nr:hypothetical protein [Acidobacteriota bacterium]
MTRDQLWLRHWVPAKAEEPEVVTKVEHAGGGIESILRAGLEHGMDRAAWLPFENNGIGHVVVAGDGWNCGVVCELIHPRKPPYPPVYATAGCVDRLC